MKRNFNQIFFLKRSKSKARATPTVYLRITIDGARTEFSLQRKCDPEKWISDKGRVHGKTEDVKAFNRYLDSVLGFKQYVRQSPVLLLSTQKIEYSQRGGICFNMQ